MKRMLFSVLLFAASVIMAQAQGFRVHRSDGAVYEFSVVADSIVFFDGEGDPNYQEPVPDYVLDAIAKLETECAWLKVDIAENRANSQNNAYQLYDLKNELEKVSDETKAYVDTEIANIKTQSDDNSYRISKLEAALDYVEAEIEAFEAFANDTYARVRALEANVDNFKENLRLLVERDAEKDAMIKALSERIAALEAKVNQ